MPLASPLRASPGQACAPVPMTIVTSVNPRSRRTNATLTARVFSQSSTGPGSPPGSRGGSTDHDIDAFIRRPAQPRLAQPTEARRRSATVERPKRQDPRASLITTLASALRLPRAARSPTRQRIDERAEGSRESSTPRLVHPSREPVSARSAVAPATNAEPTNTAAFRVRGIVVVVPETVAPKPPPRSDASSNAHGGPRTPSQSRLRSLRRSDSSRPAVCDIEVLSRLAFVRGMLLSRALRRPRRVCVLRV